MMRNASPWGLRPERTRRLRSPVVGQWGARGSLGWG
eukprot:CAMPEP_0119358552 /NCGR_PEP_ID=MMETSP1334-20130426/6743_1 /TAXON_ID=127549 /ORGANISM="Calcidiscus leptoporus, Strain RCC1130" /LENGTH=35 /DNA_ID= /DNA_START= /DNA_END= /DNA_ORIENTATION=